MSVFDKEHLGVRFVEWYFLYLCVLVFSYAIVAGLQCISMLSALSSCKVLVFLVLCKVLTAFVKNS